MSSIFFLNLSKIPGRNVDQVSPTSLKERVSLLMVELASGGSATNVATQLGSYYLLMFLQNL